MLAFDIKWHGRRELSVTILAVILAFITPQIQAQQPEHSMRITSETQSQQPEQPAPRTPLADDGIHDPLNPAIESLQDPKSSMETLPKDRRGEVDWVKALQQGYIEPRKSVSGDEYDGKSMMMDMDLDIIMTNTQEMPHVRFPHLAHTQWLSCGNCHPAIFIPEEHANSISMEKILKGEFCGRCHDKVSFSLFVCERCHSIPHKGSGPAWWSE